MRLNPPTTFLRSKEEAQELLDETVKQAGNNLVTEIVNGKHQPAIVIEEVNAYIISAGIFAHIWRVKGNYHKVISDRVVRFTLYNVEDLRDLLTNSCIHNYRLWVTSQGIVMLRCVECYQEYQVPEVEIAKHIDATYTATVE